MCAISLVESRVCIGVCDVHGLPGLCDAAGDADADGHADLLGLVQVLHLVVLAIALAVALRRVASLCGGMTKFENAFMWARFVLISH